MSFTPFGKAIRRVSVFGGNVEEFVEGVLSTSFTELKDIVK